LDAHFNKGQGCCSVKVGCFFYKRSRLLQCQGWMFLLLKVKVAAVSRLDVTLNEVQGP